MHHSAKCPKCEAAITVLKFELVDVAENNQPVAQAGLYLCPKCNTVLGAGLHPETMISDIVERLKK